MMSSLPISSASMKATLPISSARRKATLTISKMQCKCEDQPNISTLSGAGMLACLPIYIQCRYVGKPTYIQCRYVGQPTYIQCWYVSQPTYIQCQYDVYILPISSAGTKGRLTMKGGVSSHLGSLKACSTVGMPHTSLHTEYQQLIKQIKQYTVQNVMTTDVICGQKKVSSFGRILLTAWTNLSLTHMQLQLHMLRIPGSIPATQTIAGTGGTVLLLGDKDMEQLQKSSLVTLKVNWTFTMLYCTVYSQECDTTRTLTVNQSLLRNHGHWTLGWVKFSEWKKQVVVVDKLINFLIVLN